MSTFTDAILEAFKMGAANVAASVEAVKALADNDVTVNVVIPIIAPGKRTAPRDGAKGTVTVNVVVPIIDQIDTE